MKYIGNKPAIEIIQSSASRWDYVNTGNPAIDTNPEAVGATWMNITTGEEFICIDSTSGYNLWRGSLGSTQDLPDFSTLGVLAHYDFSDSSTMFTDAGTTPVALDGALVYQANDLSSASEDLTQATSGNRPTYKVYDQNGKSGLSFLGASSQYMVSATSILADDDFTIFLVSKKDNASATYVVAGHDGTAANGRWIIGGDVAPNNGKVRFFYNDGTSSYSVYTVSEPFNGAAFLLTATGDGAGYYEMYLNNIFENDYSGTPFTPYNTPTRLGGLQGAGYMTGSVNELIVFTPKLSDAMRSLIERTLMIKWGL